MGEETVEGSTFNEESFNSDSNSGAEEEFVNDFLKNVAPEHRGFVEPYYKEWGAKVTQEFQKRAEALKPWKELGLTPEQVRQNNAYVDFIEKNPTEVYARLHTYLQQTGQLPAIAQQPQQQPVVKPTLVDQYGNEVPPAVLEELEQLRTKTALTEKIVEQLGNQYLQQRQAEQQRQEQAMLDAQMATLKAANVEKGLPFDDRFIYGLMSQGIPAQQALNTFNELVMQAAQQLNKPANVPPIISSSGPAPVPQAPKLGEISKHDVQDLVASLMRQSQNS